MSRAKVRRVSVPIAQRLEDRRLMSLTVALQTPGGATSAVVTPGEVLTLNVVATVTGTDGTATNDELQELEGSFLSTAVGASAVGGNLAVTGLTSPFNSLGAVVGTAQDLNGDGHVDVGSNDTTSTAVGDYFFARADALQNNGTVNGAAMSFAVATATYTVTAVNNGGETDLAFRPRDTSQLPGTVAAVWQDAAGGTTTDKAGTFAAGAPFRVTAAASTGTVTATVFNDANGNGAQDAGEGAIAAASTVYLDVAGTGAYSSGDPSATTDGTGTATIAGVAPGTYAVRVVPPTGFTQSDPASGGAQTVTVTAGATATVAPFGIEAYGSVSGIVYTDANGSGTQDAGESGEAGVTVLLDPNSDGTPSSIGQTAVTASDGSYTFANVVAGAHTVRVVAPTNQAVTQPTGGIYTVQVQPGEAAAASPFGVSATGSVTGTVFTSSGTTTVVVPSPGVTVYLDANSNGRLDAGEATATSASDGTYALTDLAPGSYTVRPLVPLGDAVTAPAAGSDALTVTAGGTDGGADFTVAALPASTLRAAFASNPPAAAIAGATGTLKVRVGNGGGDALDAPVTVNLYASTSGTVYTESPVLGTVTKTLKLKPGKSAALAVKYTLPLTLAAGAYHLVAAASTGSASAPAQATTAGSVAVTAATIQLSPTIVAPASGVVVKAGKLVAVSVRLTNNGNVKANGTATVTVYATASGVVDAAAVPVGAATGVALKLAARKSATVKLRITGPTAMAAGSYKLVAMLSDIATTPADAGTTDTSAAVATR